MLLPRGRLQMDNIYYKNHQSSAICSLQIDTLCHPHFQKDLLSSGHGWLILQCLFMPDFSFLTSPCFYTGGVAKALFFFFPPILFLTDLERLLQKLKLHVSGCTSFQNKELQTCFTVITDLLLVHFNFCHLDCILPTAVSLQFSEYIDLQGLIQTTYIMSSHILC